MSVLGFMHLSGASGSKVRLWRHNVISEGIDMPMEQSDPDKGLLKVGVIAGGAALLVLLATFFGAL